MDLKHHGKSPDHDLLIQPPFEAVLDISNVSEEEYISKMPEIRNLLSKLNFRVYNKDEINGDLIVPKLDEDTINKIKVKAGNIGYIGDKNSATYQQLIDAGLQDGRDFD